MLPETTHRVQENTPMNVNVRIRQEIAEKVQLYALSPEKIDERLAELDREWDIERTLEANAAAVILAGVALGAAVSRKFYLLSAVAAGFLLQHSLQGWCPPLPLYRRFHVRTPEEIDHERYLLKALRGDFTRICAARDRTEREAAAIEAATRH